MNQSKISVRYAKAFFELAVEKNMLSTAIADMQLLDTANSTIPEFREFLQNPLVVPSAKKKIAASLFSEKIAKESLDFLNLIIENRRESCLHLMLLDIADMYKKHEGITDVKVSAPSALSAAQKQELQAMIEKQYNTQKVLVSETIDTSLLGGYVLQINDLLYDASVKTKLKNIKKELLTKGGL
ncbi:MAG: ATP synthase F1 subunit delta [Bacteroidales bacterium]|jgi:F-type H+-transporting ATPase subunit delta|nr:ATP synthase F1 subunit delta [Bacteroidales bacterium]